MEDKTKTKRGLCEMKENKHLKINEGEKKRKNTEKQR